MVLNLNKERVARCFRRSMHTYDTAAEVQNRLVGRLLHCLDQVPDAAFRSVLEIGCCTGMLSQQLCSLKPVQKLYCNDLVAEFEDVVMKRFVGKDSAQPVGWFGDIEELELPAELSLVISGATFQWLSDLPGFMNRLGQELVSGSWLAFSIFGPGTLREFSSLTGVELEYVTANELKVLLKDDFDLICYESFEDTLLFATVKEILNHIRETGIGGVSEYMWNKKSLQMFENAYLENFSTAKGLPVSYSSSCFVARRR